MDWWKSVKEWAGVSKRPAHELNKSQYSLVSAGELTADNLLLWLGLPEQVKNDPALAPFRQLYEKEQERPAHELNKGQYSLVSPVELTADNLLLWLGLPEKGKNDPALAPFRQLYEKEQERPAHELNKGQYSLVSPVELTADNLLLWLGLPEKGKNDPALAPFRQLYEKEQGYTETSLNKKPSDSKSKRLPLVKSAPSLSSSLQIYPETEDKDPVKRDRDDAGNGEAPKEVRVINTSTNTKNSRVAQATYYTKMTILLACWLFFTIVFLTCDEKTEVVRNSAVGFDDVNTYVLKHHIEDLSIQVSLSGPFMTEHMEKKRNSSQLQKQKYISLWIERWHVENNRDIDDVSEKDVISRENTPIWNIYINEEELVYANEKRSSIFTMISGDSTNTTQIFVIRVNTTTDRFLTPFTISYLMNPLNVHTGVVYALTLLTGLYLLIVFEVINRTMAAIVISTLSLAALALVGQRPSVPEVISWLDVETLILLFSMMILVAIMAETGLFDFLAVYTFEVTRGKLWPLVFLLCGITAVLSTFLDNVTTVLLMSPVTIRLCEVMDLDPVPILMFMAIYSNVGGTATPVGDPPCVIVASNKAVIQAGINFTNFTAHMALGILLVFIQTTVQIRFMFRDTNKLRLNVPRDIQDLRHQISIWRRAAESLPHLSKDVQVVRERLEKKIRKLSAQLNTLVKESNKRACPKETYESTLVELKGKYKIRDKVLLAKATVSICFVVVMFFLHAIPELNRVSLGWTALLGAILLLILADREDLEPILHRVEWSTLLFFAALFVLMEALSKLGLIIYVGGLMEQLILKVDESARLTVAILLIVWVSGVISAFVDNIPLTTMMIRVVVAIGTNPNLNLPLPPLIWSLLFGACLGGNGTLIAASANVVCAGVAEQHGYKFTFMQFFRVGFPIMIGHLLVSTAYLLICHCVFTWH